VEEIHHAGIVPSDIAVIVKELRKSTLSVADAARKIAVNLHKNGSLEARQAALSQGVREKEEQMAAEIRRLEEIRKAIDALGWDAGRTAVLQKLDRATREGNVEPEALLNLHTTAVGVTHAAAREQGEAVSLAGAALQALTEELRRRGKGSDVMEALRVVGRLTRDGRSLEKEVARLEAERRRLEMERAELTKMLNATQTKVKEAGAQAATMDAQIASENARLGDLQQRCDTVTRKYVTCKREIAFANEFFQYFAGHAGFYPELWSAFSSLAQVAKTRMRNPIVTELSEEARRKLAMILKKALDPDLVPRWELDDMKRQIRQEEARRLREEFTVAVTAVSGVGEAVQEKLLVAQKAIDSLRWKDI
jgi:chromosome segregation ATPase